MSPESNHGGGRGSSERGTMEVESGSGSGSGNEIQIVKRFILSASEFFWKSAKFSKKKEEMGQGQIHSFL